jgi:hypothetical protein
VSWIQSWLSGSLASYLIPVMGQVPMPLEWTFTRTSAALAVSRLEPNATSAKYFSVRSYRVRGRSKIAWVSVTDATRAGSSSSTTTARWKPIVSEVG